MNLEQVEAAGGFNVILADPPWAYGDAGCNGAAAKQYQTMAIGDIKALPVQRLAAKDAVLFLWATYPLMREALELITAWGFEYKSIAFQWVKTYKTPRPEGSQTFFGLGRWTRGNTEPVLLATRGKPKRASNDVSQLIFTEEELVVSPVGRHSAKPPEVRDRICRLTGVDGGDTRPYAIELFARDKDPRFECFGNEVSSTVTL